MFVFMERFLWNVMYVIMQGMFESKNELKVQIKRIKCKKKKRINFKIVLFKCIKNKCINISFMYGCKNIYCNIYVVRVYGRKYGYFSRYICRES